MPRAHVSFLAGSDRWNVAFVTVTLFLSLRDAAHVRVYRSFFILVSSLRGPNTVRRFFVFVVLSTSFEVYL